MKCKHCGINFESKDGKPLCETCKEHFEREMGSVKSFLDNVKGKTPEMRKTYLTPFIEDYFGEFRISTPDCVFDDLSAEWNVLMTSNNKSEMTKALSAFKRYADWYYNSFVEKVFLERVTLNSIRKVIFKSWYGTRINGLGKNGSTLDNIKEGFVSEGVYDYLLEKVFVADAKGDVLDIWPQKKILYIRKQIQKQRKKIGGSS